MQIRICEIPSDLFYRGDKFVCFVFCMTTRINIIPSIIDISPFQVVIAKFNGLYIEENSIFESCSDITLFPFDFTAVAGSWEAEFINKVTTPVGWMLDST